MGLGSHVQRERVLAVESLDPVGLVEGVEIALAEVWGDGHRGDVPPVMSGQPVHGAADDRAGGAAAQEAAAGQRVSRYPSPRSGAMATAVTCRPSCRASQFMAPLMTVPVEPPNRKPRRA